MPWWRGNGSSRGRLGVATSTHRLLYGPRMRHRARFLTAVCVILSGGCIVHETQGYPLYQPSSPARARGQIARVFGPLAKVDARDVTSLGKAFDVEPGCHVLEVRKDFLQLD